MGGVVGALLGEPLLHAPPRLFGDARRIARSSTVGQPLQASLAPAVEVPSDARRRAAGVRGDLLHVRAPVREAQDLGAKAHLGLEIRVLLDLSELGIFFLVSVGCVVMVASFDYIFEILSGKTRRTSPLGYLDLSTSSARRKLSASTIMGFPRRDGHSKVEDDRVLRKGVHTVPGPTPHYPPEFKRRGRPAGYRSSPERSIRQARPRNSASPTRHSRRLDQPSTEVDARRARRDSPPKSARSCGGCASENRVPTRGEGDPEKSRR